MLELSSDPVQTRMHRDWSYFWGASVEEPNHSGRFLGDYSDDIRS